MDSLRNLLDWLLARDPALSADDKLSRWSNIATVVSVAVAVVTWVVGLLANIPWQVAVFAGLVTWVVLSNGALTLGRAAVRKEESATAEQLEQLTARLREVEQERDGFKAENERLKDQSGEELKRRSRRLTVDMFRFAKERDKDDPQHDPNFPVWVPETEEGRRLSSSKTRYDDETWTQYRVRYEGEVRALLDALERREWCDAEQRKEIEGELDVFWRSPTQRIERVAARLDAFAKRM